MKHASSRELYAYWNARRGERMAPDRDDIEPGAISPALGDSFILAFDPSGGHPFRLAGTRLCGLFARELRNEAFESLWRPEDRAAVCSLITIVADEMGGVVAGVTGHTEEGYTIDLELLLLPLRHGGSTHARQMGALAPLAKAYWLGSSPLIHLALGAYRHLVPAADSDEATPVPEQASRQRHGFVVYEGGRSDP
jgi:hypothetical protein